MQGLIGIFFRHRYYPPLPDHDTGVAGLQESVGLGLHIAGVAEPHSLALTEPGIEVDVVVQNPPNRLLVRVQVPMAAVQFPGRIDEDFVGAAEAGLRIPCYGKRVPVIPHHAAIDLPKEVLDKPVDMGPSALLGHLYIIGEVVWVADTKYPHTKTGLLKVGGLGDGLLDIHGLGMVGDPDRLKRAGYPPHDPTGVNLVYELTDIEAGIGEDIDPVPDPIDDIVEPGVAGGLTPLQGDRHIIFQIEAVEPLYPLFARHLGDCPVYPP